MSSHIKIQLRKKGYFFNVMTAPLGKAYPAYTLQSHETFGTPRLRSVATCQSFLCPGRPVEQVEKSFSRRRPLENNKANLLICPSLTPLIHIRMSFQGQRAWGCDANLLKRHSLIICLTRFWHLELHRLEHYHAPGGSRSSAPSGNGPLTWSQISGCKMAMRRQQKISRMFVRQEKTMQEWTLLPARAFSALHQHVVLRPYSPLWISCLVDFTLAAL